MKIAIGICAYNEEKNIGKLIKSIQKQRTKHEISEIIIVSSGSTDNTNKIVKLFNDNRINLIIQENREGKSKAINLLLKEAKSDIIILISADVLPDINAFENIANSFTKDIGIVSTRLIPLNSKKKIIGFAVHLLWNLHHDINLLSPKYGECIGFRNIINEIPISAVDEEEIASIILKQFKGKYVPNAIIYNHGPENFKDFIKQRRRIYAGHLELSKRKNYETPTLNNKLVIKMTLKRLKLKEFFKVITAVFLEAYSRLLGYKDFRLNKNHSTWEISKSTKQL
jgi:poly-beta-1,6-N-acetyl-D-glucosamine synthase